MTLTRILLSLLVLLSCESCRYDPFADRYLTKKPRSLDVVGRYNLVLQTAIPGDLQAFKTRPIQIEFRGDGSFIATNVAPASSSATNPPGFANSLLSGSGSWRIGSVGGIKNVFGPEKTHWGIYLDSPGLEIQPVGLTHSRPPYGLIFTIGDPDEGTALILERQ